MRGYMFRNRWFALIFVAMVLAGVTKFVGTGNNDGALNAAKEQFAHQRAIAEDFTSSTQQVSPGQPAEDDITIEFSSDEDLIDPAVGDDPTPPDEFAPVAEAEAIPAEEIVIVSQDLPDQQESPPQ